MTMKFPLENLSLGRSGEFRESSSLRFSVFQMPSAHNNPCVQMAYFGLHILTSYTPIAEWRVLCPSEYMTAVVLFSSQALQVCKGPGSDA